MSKQDPDILILVGSPNKAGRSAKLAVALKRAFEEQGVKPCVFPLASYPVAACTGCNLCGSTGECVITGDSFGVLSRHMDSADAAIIVAPVFFAGPSGWLKAVYDRCQVYWSRRYILKQEPPAFRPLHLCVIGEGGDPFGYEPLVTITRSAMNSTGLRLGENIHDFVGKNYDLEGAKAVVAEILESL